jgi:hypothetical protein
MLDVAAFVISCVVVKFCRLEKRSNYSITNEKDSIFRPCCVSTNDVPVYYSLKSGTIYP